MAGKRKAKQPSAAKPPPREKVPQALGIDHEDAWRRRPVWRFADLDADHPSGAGRMGPDEFRELHEKLGQFELQTCSEIWGPQDNGCKRYEVEVAHRNIIDRLIELERDDETAVNTLRLQGAYRVYGILRENVYHLLWIDPEHEMWPSEKKHT